MPWGRLDDSLYDHPKLDVLGKDRLPCIGLWVLSISWCNRYLTDGVLPAERIPRLGGTKAQAERLVEAGLFDREGDGYAIHDFLSFNRSRSAVEAERAYDRDRWQRRRRPDSAPDTGPESAPESLRTPRVPSLPVPLHPVPPDRRVQVDPQKTTDEEDRAAYIARMEAQTGVPS
jgi:hypothetical protein